MTHVMEALAKVLAYQEIRQLVARYALAIDSRDLDALVALFVDDVQVGPDGSGREALRTYFDSSLREVGVTILNVGTHVIDLVDEDNATGVVYCRGEVQTGERWIQQAIAYTDTYAQRAGSWYFVRRRHELFYGMDVGVNPLAQPSANWPEHNEGRGTLPASWPTWVAFWGLPAE